MATVCVVYVSSMKTALKRGVLFQKGVTLSHMLIVCFLCLCVYVCVCLCMRERVREMVGGALAGSGNVP